MEKAGRMRMRGLESYSEMNSLSEENSGLSTVVYSARLALRRLRLVDQEFKASHTKLEDIINYMRSFLLKPRT